MAERVCPVGKHTCRNRRMSFNREPTRGPSVLFIPRQFIFFNRAISFEPFPPLCPRLYNKYSFFRSFRDGSDEMTICLFLFLLNLCQIFFLMNIERLRNREKRKCKIYSRLSRVRDATKDRLIVPSLDSTKHNCTIERVTIANDSRGPDTDTQHITKRMSPEPLETFGTIDLNQLLAPFRIAN